MWIGSGRNIDEEDSTPHKENNGFVHPSEMDSDDNDDMHENEEDDLGDQLDSGEALEPESKQMPLR